MQLIDGKKIVVYFGGYHEIEPQEDDETKIMTNEEYGKMIQAHRKKIIEGLMKSQEARDVSDLYVKMPPGLLFNPIVFTIHIPFSLQKPMYVLSEKVNSLSEDFECVFGGSLLLVATLVEVDKIPFGVFDVRDRALTILQKIMKVESIAPCLYAKPISLVTNKSQIPKKLAFGYVKIVEPSDSKTLLRGVYDELGYELNRFYKLCYVSNEIDDRVIDIDSDVTRLLRKMSESSLIGWKQKLKRRGFAKERRKDMIDVLAGLAKYQSDQSVLKIETRDFKMFYPQSAISRVIGLIDLEFYGTPHLTLDVDLITKTVEHVRSELEGYSRNTYTLLSALTGAVLGSVITLLVRAFLGT